MYCKFLAAPKFHKAKILFGSYIPLLTRKFHEFWTLTLENLQGVGHSDSTATTLAILLTWIWTCDISSDIYSIEMPHWHNPLQPKYTAVMGAFTKTKCPRTVFRKVHHAICKYCWWSAMHVILNHTHTIDLNFPWIHTNASRQNSKTPLILISRPFHWNTTILHRSRSGDQYFVYTLG